MGRLQLQHTRPIERRLSQPYVILCCVSLAGFLGCVSAAAPTSAAVGCNLCLHGDASEQTSFTKAQCVKFADNVNPDWATALAGAKFACSSSDDGITICTKASVAIAKAAIEAFNNGNNNVEGLTWALSQSLNGAAPPPFSRNVYMRYSDCPGSADADESRHQVIFADAFPTPASPSPSPKPSPSHKPSPSPKPSPPVCTLCVKAETSEQDTFSKAQCDKFATAVNADWSKALAGPKFACKSSSYGIQVCASGVLPKAAAMALSAFSNGDNNAQGLVWQIADSLTKPVPAPLARDVYMTYSNCPGSAESEHQSLHADPPRTSPPPPKQKAKPSPKPTTPSSKAPSPGRLAPSAPRCSVCIHAFTDEQASFSKTQCAKFAESVNADWSKALGGAKFACSQSKDGMVGMITVCAAAAAADAQAALTAFNNGENNAQSMPWRLGDVLTKPVPAPWFRDVFMTYSNCPGNATSEAHMSLIAEAWPGPWVSPPPPPKADGQVCQICGNVRDTSLGTYTQAQCEVFAGEVDKAWPKGFLSGLALASGFTCESAGRSVTACADMLKADAVEAIAKFRSSSIQVMFLNGPFVQAVGNVPHYGVGGVFYEAYWACDGVVGERASMHGDYWEPPAPTASNPKAPAPQA